MRALIVTLLLLTGCTPPQAGCGSGLSAGITVQLLFGRSLHDGGMVDDGAWRDFLAGVVTPRFPDGLTVLEGYGQWRQRGTGLVVGEPSSVIEIVTDDTPEIRVRLKAIRRDYKARFAQDSVGLVILRSCASF